MFDKTVIHAPQRTQFVDRNITVNEHRAPTDDSVKLLSEMELAAENKLVCRGEIRNNTLAAQWNVVQECSSGAMDFKVILRVKLNGTEHVLRFPVQYQYGHDTPAIVQEIRDKLANLITEQILINAFDDHVVSTAIRQIAAR